MVRILLWMIAGIHSLNLIIEKGDRLMLDYSATNTGPTGPVATRTTRSALSCFVLCLQMACDSVIHCKVLSTCSLYLAKEHILNANDSKGDLDQCSYIRRKDVCGSGEYVNGICLQISDSYTLMFESGNYNTDGPLSHRNIVWGYKLGLRLKVNERSLLGDGRNFTRFIPPSVIGMGFDFIQEQIMSLILLSDRSISSDTIKVYEILTSNGKKISFNSASTTPETIQTSLQWYMRKPNGTVECHSKHLNGAVTGSISDCIAAIQKGSDLYVVTSSLSGPVTIEILNSTYLEYSFPLHLDFNQDNAGEDFKPYDDSAWSVAVGRSNEALITKVIVPMEINIPNSLMENGENVQYFIDTDWYEAFAADVNGGTIRGTISDLVRAINSGSRVRVTIHTDRTRMFTLNAVFLHNSDSMVDGCTSGYLHINDILQTQRPDLRFADLETDGRIRWCTMEVGNPSVKKETEYIRTKSEWYVESRPWNCVLRTDVNQNIILGSIEDLKQAVFSQKDFRLIISYGSGYKLAVDVTEARFYEDDTFIFQYGPITMDFRTCEQENGVINESMIVQVVRRFPFQRTGSGDISYIKNAIELFIN